MEPLKNDSFGLLIAYVLPGFVALSATAFYSETVRSWLGASSSFSPSVGGFLYVTLASTALGLLISTIRWAVIDRLHHATGIRETKWDFSTLQRNFAAFEGLVQSHYRYYQFYANTLVALWFWMLSAKAAGTWDTLFGGYAAVSIAASLILFAGSRDTLRKYYARAAQLLGERDVAPLNYVDQDDV